MSATAMTELERYRNYTLWVKSHPWPCVCGRRFLTERGLNQHARFCDEYGDAEIGDPRP